MVAPSCFNTCSCEGARPRLVLTASVAGRPSLVLSYSLPADLDTPGCDGRSEAVVQAPGPSSVDACPRGPSWAASPTRCARQSASRTADCRAPRLSGVQPTRAGGACPGPRTGGLLGCVSRNPRPWPGFPVAEEQSSRFPYWRPSPSHAYPGWPAPGEALVSVVTDTRAFLMVFLLEDGGFRID